MMTSQSPSKRVRERARCVAISDAADRASSRFRQEWEKALASGAPLPPSPWDEVFRAYQRYTKAARLKKKQFARWAAIVEFRR
jgi:hypothetical protein